MPADDIEPGYYKTRLYSRGPYVPVEVVGFTRIHDGKVVVCPLSCRWWPLLNSDKWVEIDPNKELGWGLRRYFWERIDETEFKLLMAIKTLGDENE